MPVNKPANTWPRIAQDMSWAQPPRRDRFVLSDGRVPRVAVKCHKVRDVVMLSVYVYPIVRAGKDQGYYVAARTCILAPHQMSLPDTADLLVLCVEAASGCTLNVQVRSRQLRRGLV